MIEHAGHAHQLLMSFGNRATGSKWNSCPAIRMDCRLRGLPAQFGNWNGDAKRNRPQSIGKSRDCWNTRLHGVVADARMAVAFTLFPGVVTARLIVEFLHSC